MTKQVRHRSVSYLPNVQAAAVVPIGAKPTKTKPNGDESLNSEIAYWGESNTFPQTIIKKARKSTLIPATLDWKVRVLYGSGIMYGTEVVENGEIVFKPQIIPEIEDWLFHANIRDYLVQSLTDFYWFFNTFPELLMAKDRKTIAGIHANKAEECRWAKKDKNGEVKWAYRHPHWEDNPGIKDERMKKMAVLDKFYSPVENLREDDGFKYIYPVSYPTPGSKNYNLAHWNSAFESKWAEIAEAIPIFKKALLANQITIKYLIEIDEEYWFIKHDDWESKTADQRNQVVKSTLDGIEKIIMGAENTGRSIHIPKTRDADGKELQLIRVTAVDDKLKDGIYIEDSQEASSHLMYALGVDRTLVGDSPGKKMGSGSGSDKRVAFNTYLTLCTLHEDIVLEPLEFIARYNNWQVNKFKFRHSFLQTSDNIKPESRA